ncbi:BON domain-containing protein [Pseudooceanicola sp.]|uniref:BON domain-containing protein n=1 Tax=Pseudooceanicola sp. TaxID=1914328 RepID=UPI0035C6DAC5
MAYPHSRDRYYRQRADEADRRRRSDPQYRERDPFYGGARDRREIIEDAEGRRDTRDDYAADWAHPRDTRYPMAGPAWHAAGMGFDPLYLGYPPYGPYPAAYDYRPADRPPRDYDRGSSNDRGFLDRASDEVASWFGDDAAERRREADYRGYGPSNYTRSDVRIEEDVNDRLTEDSFVDASDVSVTVKDREVTLDGQVRSKQAKRRAEDCADDVSGVTHVQNNLRVAQNSDQNSRMSRAD